MRTGCNLVDQLHNILISEPCEEGKYRDSSMTSCEKCDTGKEPNTDKTGCGKRTYFLKLGTIHSDLDLSVRGFSEPSNPIISTTATCV